MSSATGKTSLLAAFAGLLFLGSQASADPVALGFYHVQASGWSQVNADTVGQYSVIVSSHFLNPDNTPGNSLEQIVHDELGVPVDQVLFRFLNNVGEQSSITRVFFDDGALMEMAVNPIGSEGVSFMEVTNGGGTLPGWNEVTPPFDPTADFAAKFVGGNANGVDAAGEYLDIVFNLLPGKTYQDVLAALSLPAGGDWLRIGIHVTGFGDGGSETFVNNPPTTPIPLPAAVWGGLALFGVIGLHRRLRR